MTEITSSSTPEETAKMDINAYFKDCIRITPPPLALEETVFTDVIRNLIAQGQLRENEDPSVRKGLNSCLNYINLPILLDPHWKAQAKKREEERDGLIKKYGKQFVDRYDSSLRRDRIANIVSFAQALIDKDYGLGLSGFDFGINEVYRLQEKVQIMGNKDPYANKPLLEKLEVVAQTRLLALRILHRFVPEDYQWPEGFQPAKFNQIIEEAKQALKQLEEQ